MKKLFCLILSTALFSTNCFAYSVNSVNKVVNIKNGNALSGIYLKIVPYDEVETSSSIVIEFSNAKVFSQEVLDGNAPSKEIGYKKGGYQYNANGSTWSGEGFNDFMPYVKTQQLPYNLKKVSSSSVEVELINVPLHNANASLIDVNGIDREPYYYIPVTIYADGVGDINATIDTNGTTIASDISALGTIYSKSNNKILSVKAKVEAYNKINLEDVVFFEKVVGSFKNASSDYITLALNDGYAFKAGSSFEVSAKDNCSFNPFEIDIEEVTDKFEFNLPKSFFYTNSGENDASINISGLCVVPTADNTKSGEVVLTVSGGGTTEKITVGKILQEEIIKEEVKKDEEVEEIKSVAVQIGSKKMVVDGKEYEIDVAPYIQTSSNSTLVPLRAVSVALYGDYENADKSENIVWDAKTKTATIKYGSDVISFTAGSNIINVNGIERNMSYGVVAEITNSRVFVPFRALGEVLGVDVSWDASTKTATFLK